jgi:hypothetical protein
MRLTCAVADLAGVFQPRFVELAADHTACYSPFSSAAGSLINRRTFDCRGVSCLRQDFRFSRYTDPIMVAFLLLSIYMIETGPAWLACAALGMAVNTQIAPLLFVP